MSPAAGALARRVALQAVDLPGGGWEADADEHGDGSADGDDALDACLVAFPHDALVDTVDSPRFARGDAIAYSIVWALTTEEAAAHAFRALADEGFASCFTAAVAAEVDPESGAAELLGHGADPVALLSGAGRAALHRARLVAATAEAALVVHLDLLALQRGTVTTMVFLADTPDAFPPADVQAVAGRVAARLPPGQAA